MAKRDYQSWNKKVLLNGLKVYAKDVVTPKLLEILTQVAQRIVEAIDNGTFEIPIYTGNLKDSTGVAIYEDGKITSFIPTKTATKMQNRGFGDNSYNIDGTEWLRNTINDAATKFPTGIWFVVMSTVPYAYQITTVGSPLGRGIGFFDRTVTEALNEILAGLRPIAEDIAVAPLTV